MRTATKPKYLVGIDPGVDTGYALWDREAGVFLEIVTASAIIAMEKVREIIAASGAGSLELRFEDARLRKGGFASRDANQAKYGAGVREGVGSVKRDSKLWQEFCEHHGVKYRAMRPAGAKTKVGAERFRLLAKWQGRTSEHARDAAMLVVGG